MTSASSIFFLSSMSMSFTWNVAINVQIQGKQAGAPYLQVTENCGKELHATKVAQFIYYLSCYNNVITMANSQLGSHFWAIHFIKQTSSFLNVFLGPNHSLATQTVHSFVWSVAILGDYSPNWATCAKGQVKTVWTVNIWITFYTVWAVSQKLSIQQWISHLLLWQWGYCTVTSHCSKQFVECGCNF